MPLISTARAIELVPQLSGVTPARLDAHVASASDAIEAACGRKIAKSVVLNEILRLDEYGSAWLERTPVVFGTFSLTDIQATPINRWRLDTDSGELEAPGHRNWLLYASYTGGFDSTPAPIELAIASLARIDIDRSASKASGEIASKTIGSVTTAYANLSTMQAIPAIPKFVMDLIAPYIMPRSIC